MESYLNQNEFDLSKVNFSSIMSTVYLWMCIGLGVTGLTAWYTYTSEWLFLAIFSNTATFYGLVIVELVLVLAFRAILNKANYVVALSCFLVYSIVNGLTLAAVFLWYTGVSIASTFFITAATFLAMSIYGYTTKKDLSGWRSYLFMGLIGIIIASIVNIFLKSDMFSFIVALIGIVIFVGLTAYDTQKIKERLYTATSESDINKIAIYGALILYLDFVNLFLKLLRVLGRRK